MAIEAQLIIMIKSRQFFPGVSPLFLVPAGHRAESHGFVSKNGER